MATTSGDFGRGHRPVTSAVAELRSSLAVFDRGRGTAAANDVVAAADSLLARLRSQPQQEQESEPLAELAATLACISSAADCPSRYVGLRCGSGGARSDA